MLTLILIDLQYEQNVVFNFRFPQHNKINRPSKTFHCYDWRGLYKYF